MIDIYVNDINHALKNRCYFSALALALSLPDICGAAEFSDVTSVAKRYIGWFDKYVYPFVGDQSDIPNLTGELVYNLRNTFLHQGLPNIDSNKIKAEREQVDKFVLLLGDGRKIRATGLHTSLDLNQIKPGAGVIHFRSFLIDVTFFCDLISSIASKYYNNNQDKFSFNFDVVPQDYFFSENSSVVDAVNKSIEKDPIGTILSSKVNEKLKTEYRIERVSTKDIRERIKKYLKALLTTMRFYDKYSEQYANQTVNADMSKQYAKFMAYLPTDASILDAGCGSGRDSLAFMQLGYDVTMLDASAGMCKCAEALTGHKALHMQFDEINFENQFDGIWACASLLHVPEDELENILVKFHHALKDNGILYASWKYGEAERQDGERFYCDMTEEKLKNVLARVGLFDCLECWVAEDSLLSGREQKWLNVIVKPLAERYNIHQK